MKRAMICLLTAGALAGCDSGEVPDAEPSPLSQPPVASRAFSSVDEVLGWGYSRTFEADLDGDGIEERLIVAADVEVDEQDRPLWEDGHRWAVVVEDGSELTPLFGDFVPNGFVEASLLQGDGSRPGPVLILTRSPSQLQLFEVEYRADEGHLLSSANYLIDSWLPGSARLP